MRAIELMEMRSLPDDGRLLSRLFPKEVGYQWRFPVNERTLKVTTIRGGDIPWWKGLIEGIVNLMLLLFFMVIAAKLDPIFAIIWVIISAAAFNFSTKSHIQLFARPPRIEVTTYEEIPDAK